MLVHLYTGITPQGDAQGKGGVSGVAMESVKWTLATNVKAVGCIK